MKWTSVSELFGRLKAGAREVLEAAAEDGLVPDSQHWYTGLVVNATSFSSQLGGLQLSLQRANSPQAHAMEPEQAPQELHQ